MDTSNMGTSNMDTSNMDTSNMDTSKMDAFQFAMGRRDWPKVDSVRVSSLSCDYCNQHYVLTFKYDKRNVSLTVNHFKFLRMENKRNRLVWLENHVLETQNFTTYTMHYTCPTLEDIAYEVFSKDRPYLIHSCCGFM
ncbi:unnamed protein product [Aspergillus oryzae var. brunneus]|uniref:Unnamed protein product n=2 Tax=Aspergillus oryzae TaxID=5062 RepID=A0AAN4YUH7_ASPOZ|nr:unnamed protein product [Aspergillus oryzae]GMG38405.1 unnamed protein product [Aspergillus oryzae]GMG55364.1 unnamed protein product [Aspergillus oryzae var. brunneus]